MFVFTIIFVLVSFYTVNKLKQQNISPISNVILKFLPLFAIIECSYYYYSPELESNNRAKIVEKFMKGLFIFTMLSIFGFGISNLHAYVMGSQYIHFGFYYKMFVHSEACVLLLYTTVYLTMDVLFNVPRDPLVCSFLTGIKNNAPNTQ